MVDSYSLAVKIISISTPSSPVIDMDKLVVFDIPTVSLNVCVTYVFPFELSKVAISCRVSRIGGW